MIKKTKWMLRISLLLAFSLFENCHSHDPHDPELIFVTQVPIDNAVFLKNDWSDKFYNKSRIVSLRTNEAEKSFKVLTSDLHSAALASVSFNSQTIAFMAKSDESESWQIWTMNFNGKDKKQLTSDSMNCINPVFLPDGKIAFSRTRPEKENFVYHLFTCNAEGLDLQQISYHPNRDFNISLLHDGRISFLSNQVDPEKLPNKWMVIRPDGTKCEEFYKIDEPFSIKSKCTETNEGVLFFVERSSAKDQLVQISYSNPGPSRRVMLIEPHGALHSVAHLDSGNVILSRQLESNIYGLYQYKTNDFSQEPIKIYLDSLYHSVDAESSNKNFIPKKLPTSISTKKQSGILFGQNAFNQDTSYGESRSSSFIVVDGLTSSYGEVSVESDGSFLVELPANQPFKLSYLNTQKERVGNPSPWIWLRPGERRGCIGCHQKSKLAPENIAPIAISKEPQKLLGRNMEGSESIVHWHNKNEGEHDN